MSFRHKQARRSEAGNVFFALFGTIVLLGVLGATVSGFIKGPLTSSIKVTRDSVADTQMSMIAQVIVMASGAQPNCDTDADVEPVMWRTASGIPIPTGGGLVPTTLGVATTADPWGTQYGYCTWDHGADSCGGTNRLAGTPNNPDSHTVIALVSAGPDKVFTTTCRSFAVADVNVDGDLDDATDLTLISKAASTDDDILYTYSVSEATGASGGVGLWSLISSTTAGIDKNIDVKGGARFTGAGQFAGLATDSIASNAADAIDFMQGFRVPNVSTFPNACDDDLVGVLRRNGSSLELCIDDTWTSVSGSAGGGGSGLPGFEPDTTGVCDSTTLGDIRYNSASGRVEYCNGSNWRSLTSQSSASVALSVTPTTATGMDAAGPCFPLYCPYAYGALRIFTITNVGTSTSAALSVEFMGPNRSNFELNAAQSTCVGATLAPAGTCTVAVRSRADGNFAYNASVVVSAAATPLAAIGLSGSGTGFTCQPGMRGWGGIVVTCANSTTPDYIINEPGCPIGSLVEPTCGASGALDPQMSLSLGDYWPSLERTSGAQNTADFLAYGGGPAFIYCDQFIKGGYSNWFLPSYAEYESIIAPLVPQLSMDGTAYWTASARSGSYGGDDGGTVFTTATRREDTASGYDMRSVRCMRRHGVATPTATADTYVDMRVPTLSYSYEVGLDLGHAFAQTSGQVITSAPMNIRSINTGVTIGITGPGSPTVSINGATGVSSGTVRVGDTITITGAGPTTQSTENVFQLRIGEKSYQWGIYYLPTATAQIFVTNSTFNGNRGATGIAGADTACQTAKTAAGLAGNWYAVLADGPNLIHPRYRLPWGWNRLENRGGEIVANDINDLFDGSIVSPIRYNESGVFAPSKKVWSGLYTEDAVSSVDAWGNGTCQGWTIGTSAFQTYVGDSGATGSSVFFQWPDTCNQTRSFYCMGPF